MNKFKYAFTIIELSIIIIVLSILISGIIKGNDLYEDYRYTLLKSTDALFKSRLYYNYGDIAFHIDATDLKTFFGNDKGIIKDNQKLSQIYNIIPDGLKTKDFNLGINKLIQTNTNLQPTLNNGNLNGFPSIKFFDSTTNLYFYQSVNGWDFFQNTSDGNIFTFFIVQLFPNSLSDRSNIWTWQNSCIRNNALFTCSGNIFTGKKIGINFANCCYWDRDYYVDNTKISKPQVVSVKKRGCSVIFKIDGKIANQSPSGNKCHNGDPGYTHTLNIGNFEGYVGELIFFREDLTDSNIQTIENFLIKKWHIK
jgi:hypothetical protein